MVFSTGFGADFLRTIQEIGSDERLQYNLLSVE